VTQPVDRNILLEIVRVVGTRAKVPEKVRVRGSEYQLTYLDDHKHRLEDALMRHDLDRLNMLYGQLASKVKYQLLRQTPARRAETESKKRATTKGSAGRATAPERTRSSAVSKRKDAQRKTTSAKKRRPAAPKKARATKKTASSRAGLRENRRRWRTQAPAVCTAQARAWRALTRARARSPRSVG
jgi:hypothetical protein